MYSNNNYQGIDPIIISIVRSKAQELSRHKYFLQDDIEDIEQELMIDVLMKRTMFDPTKSSLWCYVQKIVENKCSTLIREASAKKRGGDKIFCSLYQAAYAFDDDDILIIDAIAETATFFDFSTYRKDEELIADIDMKRILEKLPPVLAQVCQLLHVMNLSEIAKEIGVSRVTLYRFLEKIKVLVKSMGVTAYA